MLQPPREGSVGRTQKGKRVAHAGASGMCTGPLCFSLFLSLCQTEPVPRAQGPSLPTTPRAHTHRACCNVPLCLSTAKYPLILHGKDPAMAPPLGGNICTPPFQPRLPRTNSWFPPDSRISPHVCFFLLECNHLFLNVGLLFF